MFHVVQVIIKRKIYFKLHLQFTSKQIPSYEMFNIISYIPIFVYCRDSWQSKRLDLFPAHILHLLINNYLDTHCYTALSTVLTENFGKVITQAQQFIFNYICEFSIFSPFNPILSFLEVRCNALSLQTARESLCQKKLTLLNYNNTTCYFVTNCFIFNWNIFWSATAMDMILLESALKVGFDIYLELQIFDQKFKLLL